MQLFKGFPDEICSNCMDQLQSFYKFKLQVEKSEFVLRKHLGPFDDRHVPYNPLTRHDVNPLNFSSPALESHMKLKTELQSPFIEHEPLDLKVNHTD